MAAGNYSVEASVVENGKTVKGTLTLFIDEYVFGSSRRTIDWENAVCERGTVSVKGFLRSVDKPCITFKEGSNSSPHFILEQAQLNTVLNAVKEFVELKKRTRAEKAAKEQAAAEAARKKELEKQRQLDEENRIREEAQRKADEEYRQKKETEQRQKEETERQAREAYERKMADKKVRIQKEVDAVKEQQIHETLDLDVLSKKAGSDFLDNPYRILGISCCATNEEANTALDKLKKLARLKALGSYNSPFDLVGIEKPVRDLSVAQNALTLLKEQQMVLVFRFRCLRCVAKRKIPN